MLNSIQALYEKQLSFLSHRQGELSGYSLICGNQDFLIDQHNKSYDIKVLILDRTEVSWSVLNKIQPHILIDTDDLGLLENKIFSFCADLNKKNHAQKIKTSTEAKKNELERLNRFLLSESAEKKTALDEFQNQELLRKNKEKKLLFFFDYINSEMDRSDFVSDLMKHLATDFKKMGSFYRYGFFIKNQKGLGFIFESDGKSEKTKFLDQTLKISKEDFHIQLANLLQRPIGKIIQWQIQAEGSEFYFYIESQGKEIDTQAFDDYFKDRLSLISLSASRWFSEFIEKRVMNQWRQLFQAYHDPIHVVDHDFNLVHSNYHNKSVANLKCYQILAERSEPCVNCPVIHKMSERQVKISQNDYEILHTEFEVDQKKYFFMVYENQNQLNQLKLNLIQNEKMSTLGQLANHLMHELNNPLTGLKMYAEMLLQDPRVLNQATVQSDMKEVLKAVERSQIIVKDLSRFANDQNVELEPVDLLNLVNKTMVFLKSLLRQHRVFVDLKPTFVTGQFIYLQQVLFNLIKNACQAMKEKGSIKIYFIEQKESYDLIVEDDGPGLPAEIQQAVFTPFQTTKSQGEGTGLGLFLSKKLMVKMGADLVYNEDYKKGAQFILRFKK